MPGKTPSGRGAGRRPRKRMRTPQPPQACSPRPSRSRRASTSSAMTRWRATSLASMRPRPLGSADCRPRTSSGSCEALRAPNSSRGAWSAQDEVRACGPAPHPGTAGWQARWPGVRGPGEPPPGQGAHILDLPLLHHALGEEGRHEVHGVRQEDGAH